MKCGWIDEKDNTKMLEIFIKFHKVKLRGTDIYFTLENDKILKNRR